MPADAWRSTLGEGEGGIRHTKIQHKNNQDICAAQRFSSKLGIVMALARNVVSGTRKYLAKKTTTKNLFKRSDSWEDTFRRTVSCPLGQIICHTFNTCTVGKVWCSFQLHQPQNQLFPDQALWKRETAHVLHPNPPLPQITLTLLSANTCRFPANLKRVHCALFNTSPLLGSGGKWTLEGTLSE